MTAKRADPAARFRGAEPYPVVHSGGGEPTAVRPDGDAVDGLGPLRTASTSTLGTLIHVPEDEFAPGGVFKWPGPATSILDLPHHQAARIRTKCGVSRK